MFNVFRWDVNICFVDIGKIVADHCLNFPFILFVLQKKENGILDTDSHSDISSGSSSLSDDSFIAYGDDKAKVSNVVMETR